MTIFQESDNLQVGLEEQLVETQPEPEKSLSFMDILRIPTGPGSLAEYKDSPLNFDSSEGLARIIRGASGFLGADVLRSAVIDVVFGAIKWGSDRKVKPIVTQG